MLQLRRMHCALLLVLSVHLFFAPVQPVHAQREAETSFLFTFEEMGFLQDRVATGTTTTFFYDLPVPKSWRGVKPTINLHFSHSNLLLPDLSQITVLYNDIPVADVRLTAENAASGWLRIVIPEYLLKENKHQLKISFYQRLTDASCGDSGTEAGLWTVVHKDSTIDFKVSSKANLDLSWFPEPFSIYGRKALAPVKVTLALPAEPSEYDLQAAGLVAARLGQLISMRMLDLSVHFGKIPATGNVVIIGRNADVNGMLDADIKMPVPLRGNDFSSSLTIASTEGVIQLGKRKDDSGLLLISSMNETGLLNAAMAMANGDSLRLMTGSYTIVKDAPATVAPPAERQQIATLKELSKSGDQRVEGINVQEVSYCFRLPPNWAIGTDAQLDLNYAFSPNLWTERSSLVVRLNNTTVASTKLSAEPTGGNRLQIPLPPDRFVDGYNCLRFLYTLRAEQSECVAVMGGELWAEIDSQSTLFLPFTEESVDKDKWQPDMDQYPYPFNIDYDLQNTTLILPSVPTKSEMIAALQMAAKLGSEALAQNLHLTIKSADRWDNQTDSDDNLILIGSEKQNSAVATFLEQQKLVTPDNELTLQVRNEINSRQQTGAKLAVAEVSTSPWASDRVVLRLTNNSETALANMIEVLTRNANEEKLDGNIVTVTEDPIVRNVDTLDRKMTLDDVKVTDQGIIAAIPETKSTIRSFLVGGLIVLCVVAFLLLFLTIRERRKHPLENMSAGD